MSANTFQKIKNSLHELYLKDARPWLVGFSGGKDSTLVAALVFEAVMAVPPEHRNKEINVVCTDTRVEIPAVVEAIETTLARMRKCAADNDLKLEVHLLRPPAEHSFWANIIGRGYPPPNRTFRWCTQRLKIDPVTRFVERRMGRWGEAILHLGARRAESATRAQTLGKRDTRNGLTRHPDLPRVWVSNPIEHLSTEEVWAWLLQHPNPWGGDNRALYKLYANAGGGGECPIHIDTSTPSCGNSRFGCWTCTVVERDKASEGLLASGDDRMEDLLAFRETLLEFRNPENGRRDMRRMNGAEGPGPLKIEARRELLKRLLKLQEETKLILISDEELLLIQQAWKAARDPDDGRGVARIVNRQQGVTMKDLKEVNRLRELQEKVAKEKGISADTLRRLLAKVDEFTESHRAMGLPDDLMNILKDDLEQRSNGGNGNG